MSKLRNSVGEKSAQTVQDRNIYYWVGKAAQERVPTERILEKEKESQGMVYVIPNKHWLLRVMLSSSRGDSQLLSGVMVEEDLRKPNVFITVALVFVSQYLRSSADLEASKVIQKFSWLLLSLRFGETGSDIQKEKCSPGAVCTKAKVVIWASRYIEEATWA